jgi:hypothetical protein
MMSNKGTKDWGAGEKSRLELGHVLFRRNQINLPKHPNQACTCFLFVCSFQVSAIYTRVLLFSHLVDFFYGQTRCENSNTLIYTGILESDEDQLVVIESDISFWEDHLSVSVRWRYRVKQREDQSPQACICRIEPPIE